MMNEVAIEKIEELEEEIRGFKSEIADIKDNPTKYVDVDTFIDYCEEVVVLGYTYKSAEILREMDPIAFDEEFSNFASAWVDSLIEDLWWEVEKREDDINDIRDEIFS